MRQDFLKFRIVRLAKSTILIILAAMSASTAHADDASNTLGATWGTSGPRYEQWVKTILAFAANTGYSFHGVTGRVTGSHTRTVLVLFRDYAKNVQYVGWYDPDLDVARHPLAMGLNPAGSLQLQAQNFSTGEWVSKIPTSQSDALNTANYVTAMGGPGSSSLDQMGLRIYGQAGCTRSSYFCSTDVWHQNSDGSWDRLRVVVDWPGDGTAVTGDWHRKSKRDSSTYNLINGIILTVAGAGIGELVGITNAAANAGFAASFGTYTNAVMQGATLSDALLEAMKSGALAYTGAFVLNTWGDPTAKVGVSGLGCPTGDKCWYLDLMNGVPPIKSLAEVHDPFIDWSVNAYGSIGGSAWYKAVTIPPFAVVGCAANPSCVTGGIIIASENEGR